MKNVGILLILGGAGSFALNLFGYEFSLLMWIDMWGETVGWAIRGAMIVVGGALVFMGMRSEASVGPAEEPAAPAQMSHESEPTFESQTPVENR